jgi:hypothetical protein
MNEYALQARRWKKLWGGGGKKIGLGKMKTVYRMRKSVKKEGE